MTGSISEEVAVACMKQGAADYLLKDRLTRLGPAVQQALEQKQARDEKQQAEAASTRLLAILQATTDFVAIADANGRGLYLNRAGRKLVGLDEDEDVTGNPVVESHPEWARTLVLNKGYPGAIREGVWRGETALLGRDGLEIPVSQVIIAHKAPDGSIEFFSTIARDITERKQRERELEAIASVLSHYAPRSAAPGHLMASCTGQSEWSAVPDPACSGGQGGHAYRAGRMPSGRTAADPASGVGARARDHRAPSADF